MTPTKGEQSQQHDRGALEMFLRFFGKDRKPATLSQRDWTVHPSAAGGQHRPESEAGGGPDGRTGSEVPAGGPHWAARSRNEAGALLLGSNPLKCLKVPREKNPTRWFSLRRSTRPCSGVSAEIDWRFRVRLCSRTRQGTASAQSANCGGRTSTGEPE